ncbi:hypothetical protein [Actinorugispora endophytica]|uniref:Uncharacterized protein n=1 Tax=Actinorugispora endophytica TaxID=1605990 RepID=A0A4R6UX32_9ACTN|nr:hypothetical protein [Actinorugispora endophytica]TDQ51988.1 hypothetical protein EV190_109101 [Actinorugispora endophytica]
MVYPEHTRPTSPSVVLTRSNERQHLARLASALAPYGIWARVIEDGVPFLRASNPASEFATEDIACERSAYGYAFVTSFGLRVGGSDHPPRSARRIALLLGVTAP